MASRVPHRKAGIRSHVKPGLSAAAFKRSRTLTSARSSVHVHARAFTQRVGWSQGKGPVLVDEHRIARIVEDVLGKRGVGLPDSPAGDSPLPEGYADAVQRSNLSLLESLDTVKSGQANKLLSPRSESDSRSLVKKLRDSGDLIGLPRGQRPDYVYPVFQFDRARHRVHPVVAHANQLIGAASDPWGAASWWMTPAEPLDDATPLTLLESGRLTEQHVDAAVLWAQRAM